MWRSILAAVLLPSLTAAQAAQTTPQSEAPKLQQSKPARPDSYHPYTFYNAIRRGTNEDVAVELSSVSFATTPRSPVAGILPLNLELQPVEGLTLTKIRYPKAQARHLKFTPDPVPVAEPAFMQLKVHADQTAPLGLQVLTGKLTFQPIRTDTGVGPVQQMDVVIPITVVEHDAKVTRQGWPIHHTPVGVWIALIVLFPLLIAVLPFYLICIAAAPQRCPD